MTDLDKVSESKLNYGHSEHCLAHGTLLLLFIVRSSLLLCMYVRMCVCMYYLNMILELSMYVHVCTCMYVCMYVVSMYASFNEWVSMYE